MPHLFNQPRPRLTTGRGLLLIGALSAATAGCTTASDRLSKRLKVGETVQDVYFAPYSEVETALKQAMIIYPQRIDNTEAGIFETDYVKGELRFRPPHQEGDFSRGYRYRILARLVKGKVQSKPAVYVQLTKKIELARDFFADPDQLASDGLEERVILYRIGRELAINRGLQKAASKSGSNPDPAAKTSEQ